MARRIFRFLQVVFRPDQGSAGDFGSTELAELPSAELWGDMLVKQFRAQLGPAGHPELGVDGLDVILDG